MKDNLVRSNVNVFSLNKVVIGQDKSDTEMTNGDDSMEADGLRSWSLRPDSGQRS